MTGVKRFNLDGEFEKIIQKRVTRFESGLNLSWAWPQESISFYGPFYGGLLLPHREIQSTNLYPGLNWIKYTKINSKNRILPHRFETV